jgi:hypothetical protein
MTVADRITVVRGIVQEAIRHAAFSDDRGYEFDAVPYREKLAVHFAAEPELQRLLPYLWREIRDSSAPNFMSLSEQDLAVEFWHASAVAEALGYMP